jgi:hypothetical protein
MPGFLNALGDFITNPIGATLDAVGVDVDSIIKRVDDAISRNMRRVNERIDGLSSKLLGPIVGALQGVFQVIVDQSNRVQSAISSGLDSTYTQLGGLLGGLESSLVDAIDDVIVDVTEATTNVVAGLVSGIDTVSTAIERANNAVISGLGQAIVVSQATVLELFAEGNALVVNSVIKSTELLAGGITTIAGEAGRGLLNFFGGSIPDEERDLLNCVGPVLGLLKNIPNLPDPIRKLCNLNPDEPHFYQFAIGLIAGAGVLQQLSGAALAGPMAEIQAWSLGLTTPQRPPMWDAIRLVSSGVISQEAYVGWAKRIGLDEIDALRLLELNKLRLPPPELVSLARRNLIPSDVAASEMRIQGWEPEQQLLLEAATRQLPTLQDIVRFAVREAYTPEIAERFGQYEDLPDAYLVEAAKVGADTTLSRQFWASHWDLPSPQMGFEMLHRGVIDESDLSLLLRSLDIMPFWRDKLTQISYNPLTRVDVRRMHRLGILDRAGVYRAYLDIGYNAERAEQLTQFTEQLNAPKAQTEEPVERDLTKAEILGAYRDGLLTDIDTLSMLLQMGYSDDESALLISRETLKLEIKDRNEEAAIIVQKGLRGLLDFDSVQDALGKLDLTARETERYITQLRREREKIIRLPTLKDLQEFLFGKFITLDKFKLSLHNMGFSDDWVDVYVAQAQQPRK